MIYSLSSKSNAKINLLLHVINKRNDGYHNIESVIAFTSLYDTVTVTAHNKLEVVFTNAIAAKYDAIDPINNTVYKAATLLAEHAKQDAHALITIEKNIPIASGLGGGSTNAATTLNLLKQFWSVEISNQDLDKIALQIGTDTVVCLRHRLCMVKGIGEQVEILKQNFGTEDMQVLLINPNIPLLAKTVYQAYRGPYRDSMTLKEPKQIFNGSFNDLQIPASQIVPEITEIINALKQQEGCKLARMSGSGTTCFAIFENNQQLQEAESRLNRKWWAKAVTIF